jgi:hypothetical protein
LRPLIVEILDDPLHVEVCRRVLVLSDDTPIVVEDIVAKDSNVIVSPLTTSRRDYVVASGLVDARRK